MYLIYTYIYICTNIYIYLYVCISFFTMFNSGKMVPLGWPSGSGCKMNSWRCVCTMKSFWENAAGWRMPRKTTKLHKLRRNSKCLRRHSGMNMSQTWIIQSGGTLWSICRGQAAHGAFANVANATRSLSSQVKAGRSVDSMSSLWFCSHVEVVYNAHHQVLEAQEVLGATIDMLESKLGFNGPTKLM